MINAYLALLHLTSNPIPLPVTKIGMDGIPYTMYTGANIHD